MRFEVVSSELADTRLYDCEGNQVPFSKIISDKRKVIVFVRHFG